MVADGQFHGGAKPGVAGKKKLLKRLVSRNN